MYLLNDYLFHTGSYDLHIVQGIPDKRLNYATIFKPFDVYIWAYIGISVVAVTIAFVVIEKTYTNWTEIQLKDVISQSIHFFKN